MKPGVPRFCISRPSIADLVLTVLRMVQGVNIATPLYTTMPSNGISVKKSFEDVEIESANEVELGSHEAEGHAVDGEIFSGINKQTILAFLVWLVPSKAHRTFC